MLGCEASISHCGIPASQSHTVTEAVTKTCQRLQETAGFTGFLITNVAKTSFLKTENAPSRCQPPDIPVPSSAQVGGAPAPSTFVPPSQVSRAGDSPAWWGGAGGTPPRTVFAGSLWVFPACPPAQRKSRLSSSSWPWIINVSSWR